MPVSGFIDAAMYVVLTAVSFVFLNKFCQNIDPVIALFVMSAVAIITFNALSFRHIKSTYLACSKHKLLFFTMSGTLAFDWVCMLYASHLADPFVAMAGLFIALAIIGFGKLFIKNRSLSNLVSIALLVISTILLFFSYQVQPSQHLGLGIILGVAAGVAFYVYIASSGSLAHKGGLTTMQVLATRFWVLCLGSAFFVPYGRALPIIAENILPLLLISYASLIVPIYFNQRAILKLGSAITAVVISFTPPATYFFYVIYNHNLTVNNTIICLIISFALVFPYIIKLIKNPSHW